MDQSKLRELEELLKAKTKAELSLLANKLKIQDYSRLTKPELIRELLEKPRALNREISTSFWDRHSGHVYGLASIIGLIVAAFSLYPQLTQKASANGYESPLSEETREGVVVVMPFENQTGNPDLKSISFMLMDWVSQGLLETGETRVIKEEANTLIAHLEENPGYIPPGAEVLIRGTYYKAGKDKLSVVAEIVDAATNVVLYSPNPFTGSSDDPMALIEDIKQQILGYWMLKDDYRGHKPPRYDAYEAYVKGIETSYLEWELRAKYLRSAMELDPEFYSPGISLMYTGVNSGRPELVKEGHEWLMERETGFNEYERLNYRMAKSRGFGDFEEGAEAGLEMYRKFGVIGGARMALYFYNSANMLSKVLHLIEEMETKEETNFLDDEKMATAIAYKMNALIKTGRADSAAVLYDKASFKPDHAFIPILGLKAYAITNQFDKIDSVLNHYTEVRIYYSDLEANSWIYYSLCTQLYLDDHPELPKYLDLWEEHTQKELNGIDFVVAISELCIDLMRGDLEHAYEHSLEYYATDWGKGLGSQMPGLLLIKMGKVKEGREWMEFLMEQPEVYTSQKDHALGFLYGYLGETDKAVKHFKISVEKGFDYDWYDFRDDPFWKEFLDNPKLMEFTEPT